MEDGMKMNKLAALLVAIFINLIGLLGFAAPSWAYLQEDVDMLMNDNECPVCILNEADLTGAQLNHANLKVASLTGANLTGADLSETNLMLSELIGTNLTNARMIGEAEVDEIQDIIRTDKIGDHIICERVAVQYALIIPASTGNRIIA